MAAPLIAHLEGFYYPGPAGGKGEFRLSSSYVLEQQRMYAELQAKARGQPYAVEFDVRRTRRRRTMNQNNLMWALLDKMARAYGNTTAMDCYLQMLAEHGEVVEYLEVDTRCLPVLRKTVRVVDIMELLPGGRARVRVCFGSSTYDKSEMRDFLECVFDRLAEMGVDDAETTEQYRKWREVQE